MKLRIELVGIEEYPAEGLVQLPCISLARGLH